MITIRGREYSEYFQRQEKVRNQKVTEESWTAIAGRIRVLESEISLAEQQIRERAETVSYTHLDVYKRQARSRI